MFLFSRALQSSERYFCPCGAFSPLCAERRLGGGLSITTHGEQTRDLAMWGGVRVKVE